MKAYQIKMELMDSRPLVWRRVIVPAGITFKRLHDTIQMAMGWWDSHMYEFSIPAENIRVTLDEETVGAYKYYRDKYRDQPPSKDEDPYGRITSVLSRPVKNAKTAKIDAYLEKHHVIEYVYDFGDYWQLKLTLERIIEDYGFGYPQILKGEGAAPPEDVGGTGGYEAFLEVWNDPGHPEHESIRNWAELQDYEEKFDRHKLNVLLQKYLKLKRVK